MGKYRAAVYDKMILPAMSRLPAEDDAVFRALGREVAAPIAVMLIIDTGSKRTSLVPSVLDCLAPTAAGRVNIETTVASAQTELF